MNRALSNGFMDSGSGSTQAFVPVRRRQNEKLGDVTHGWDCITVRGYGVRRGTTYQEATETSDSC